MPNLVPFSFESFNVRIITDDNGELAFVGKDACDALEYANHNDAMNTHCKGVAERYPLQTAGGIQKVRIIREPDLYRLIAGSTLPSAERFEKWLFEEVLPSIRKTGSYQIEPSTAKQIDANITALKLSPIAARAAKAFGFKGNMATLSADHAVRLITGSSPLVLFGQTALKAENQDALLLVTEIGERMGIKARDVNALMTKSGLKTEYRDAQG